MLVKQTKYHSPFKHMVTMLCLSCATKKEVDMNMCWQRTKDQRKRFQNATCSGCKTFNRLGKWLRRPHETHNSIETWLKHNNTYNCTLRDATMTIDLFLTQDMNEGVLRSTNMTCATVTEDRLMAPDENKDNSDKDQRKHLKRKLSDGVNDIMKNKSRHTGVVYCIHPMGTNS